jgi:hypothetical protein
VKASNDDDSQRDGVTLKVDYYFGGGAFETRVRAAVVLDTRGRADGCKVMG